MNKIRVNIEFGKRLTNLRKIKGLSQEALAFKCEIDRTYVGIIERGEKSPTLNTLEKIAKGLNINLSELLNF